MTTDKNNFVFPPRKPRGDRGDVVFTSCSRCFPIDTQAIRSKILDLAMRGKLTEQLPEDGTAEELYRQIQAEKHALIKAGKIKKEKLLPEISEGERPFPLPASWRWVHLGALFQHNTGKALNSSNSQGQQLEYITTSNLYWNRFELDGLKTMLFTDRELEKCTVTKGDLLVCEGGDIGRSAVWPYDYDMRIQNHIHRLRRYSSNICTEFYYYLLWFYKQTDRIGGIGIGLQGFSSKKVHSLIVPLAPYGEARRIVARIEQAFSALDTIDALQTKYADNLAVLKSKLIDAAIRGKLTEQLTEDGTAEELYRHLREKKRDIEDSGILKGRQKKTILPVDDVDFPFPIPATWKWIRLDSVAEIFGRIGFRGYTKSDIVKQGEGAISLSPSNISIDGKCVYDKCTYITWEKYEESPEIIVAEEDLIIVKTGSSYGKCGVVKELPEKATINPQLALLKYILCDRYYLHTVLNSTMARKQYEDFVVGAATPTFSQENLANLILPLPPLAEQKRIVERVSELLTVCDELKIASKRMEL